MKLSLADIRGTVGIAGGVCSVVDRCSVPDGAGPVYAFLVMCDGTYGGENWQVPHAHRSSSYVCLKKTVQGRNVARI